MTFSLFPRIPEFYDLFTRHSDLTRRAAAQLDAMVQPGADRIEPGQAIVGLEKSGAALSRDISRELSLTFITPIDREDIHLINMAAQNVLYLIRALSTRLGLYGIADIRPAARDLIQHLRCLVDISGDMLGRLRQRREVEDLMVRVHALRDETDLLLLVALGELYELDITAPGAVREVILWSQIYDRLEEGLRGAEALAGAIEGVVLKNA